MAWKDRRTDNGLEGFRRLAFPTGTFSAVRSGLAQAGYEVQAPSLRKCCGRRDKQPESVTEPASDALGSGLIIFFP